MSIISKITKTPSKLAESYILKLAKDSKINKSIDQVLQNPQYAARTIAGTVITKDAFEHGILFYQSINNDKIPKEKRPFVAAMDLSTGILTCCAQLGAAFAFTSERLQNKIMSKIFEVADKDGKFMQRLKKGFVVFRKNEAGDIIKKNIDDKYFFRHCKAGCLAVTTLLVTSVITKRIVVPFLATPMASWIKETFMEQENNNEQNHNGMKKPLSYQGNLAKKSYNHDVFKKFLK